MSLSATSSGSPATNRNAKPETVNPFYTELPPSNWGDHFLIIPSHLKSSGESIQQEHEQLKQEVRRILTVTDNVSDDLPLSQRLGLIDAVQRLGVGYHFASEIEDELQKLVDQDCTLDQDDLHVAALRFRLLRQHGIRTPCDKFEKFKDCQGNFKESLSFDVQGMLSLYEAAHLAIRGEDVLDEALAFATKNLESILLTDRVSPQEAEEISHALNRPIRKCAPRLAARQFITAYSMDESHNKALLRFAKLDFNILQELHQKELSALTRWWKTMDVTTKLPFARDRMVELYFFILGVYFEPQYSFARIIVAKIIAVASIIDDTYDNFGTYEELELLTEAIQRWDNEAMDILPESMKLSFTILFVTYKEIEEELAKEGIQFSMYYAKEARKTLARYYLVEAKWREEGFVPTVEEHLDVSVTSSCFPMLILSSFLGMGAIATKEAFEWASNDPKIVRASSLICRLMDDIVAPQFEHKRVHVASVVQCYMKQQQGVSEEEVVSLLRKQIVDAWKDINDECLRPIAAPMPLLERVLNFARVMDVMYKEEDFFTGSSPVMKGYVASLFVDPVPL